MYMGCWAARGTLRTGFGGEADDDMSRKICILQKELSYSGAVQRVPKSVS